MKKLLLTFLVLFLLQTITYAIGSKSTMEKIMGSWMGEHIDSVIEKWGYPTSEKKLAEHYLYVWDSGNTLTEDIWGLGYKQQPSCTRTFEVDSANKIIKGVAVGVECPATYLTGKKWVNPRNNPWDKE